MIIRVAIVREAPPLFQVGTILQMIEVQAQCAAEHGAQAIFWPESYIPGVTRGLTFGSVGSYGADPDTVWRRRLLEASVTQGDKVCRFLADLARKYSLFLAIPVNEARLGSMFCSIFYFSPKEGLVAVYSKLKATAAERIIWTQGNQLVLLHTQLGIIHQCICWENMMPAAYTWGFLQDAQLHFAPTMDAGAPWERIQSLACTGAAFVITAAAETRREHYPDAYVQHLVTRMIAIGHTEQDVERILTTVGGAGVYHPNHADVLPYLYESQALTITELNLDDLIEARFQFDIHGTDASPHIFQLQVNPSVVNIVSVMPW